MWYVYMRNGNVCTQAGRKLPLGFFLVLWMWHVTSCKYASSSTSLVFGALTIGASSRFFAWSLHFRQDDKIITVQVAPGSSWTRWEKSAPKCNRTMIYCARNSTIGPLAVHALLGAYALLGAWTPNTTLRLPYMRTARGNQSYHLKPGGWTSYHVQ